MSESCLDTRDWGEPPDEPCGLCGIKLLKYKWSRISIGRSENAKRAVFCESCGDIVWETDSDEDLDALEINWKGGQYVRSNP